MLKTLSPLLIALLAGCAQNTVSVDGKDYEVDDSGVILMSPAELQELQKSGQIMAETSIDDLNLTPAEYQIALSDEEAFFSLAGEANPDEPVSALLRVGSLKDNLNRIARENYWKGVVWDGPDFFIQNPKIVKDVDLETTILNIAADYPLYICTDAQERVITIIAN